MRVTVRNNSTRLRRIMVCLLHYIHLRISGYAWVDVMQ
jgi:hypothetical protein